MEKANETQASEKQKQFIEALAKKNKVKVEKPLEELSFTEASELIDNLKKVGNSSDKRTRSREQNGSEGRDDVKLGLATKCVYNRWLNQGQYVTRNTTTKEAFINEVLDTYQVFKEACQRAAEIEDKDKKGKADQAKPKDLEHRR